MKESLVNEAKVLVSWYSLMLFFNDLLLILSCDMQQLNQFIFLFPLQLQPFHIHIQKIIKTLHWIVVKLYTGTSIDVRSNSICTRNVVWNEEINPFLPINFLGTGKTRSSYWSLRKPKKIIPLLCFASFFQQIHWLRIGKWLGQFYYIWKRRLTPIFS